MRAVRFNDLSMVEKSWLIKEFGMHLMSIEFYDHRIHLYALNSDFIELYQNVDTRQVEKIAIASYTAIDKYLSRIVLGNVRKK